MMHKTSGCRIGYACVNPDVREGGFKSCRLADATEDRLRGLISHNLRALDKIIDYNVKHKILLFRISSDLIPFGSRPERFIDWRTEFQQDFDKIGRKIKDSGMRVSMHPGQYTVLNSNRPEVVLASVRDLAYHADVLSLLGTSQENKIILHIGGAYGDKKAAKEAFVHQYGLLSNEIKRRLIIENDDKLFHIADVLSISKTTGAPVVYDNLHEIINPADSKTTADIWIKHARETWGEKDGRQKIHYSQQDEHKKGGAHSQTIAPGLFLPFYQQLPSHDIDIMLEVKDKNRSAMKIALCLQPDIGGLEREWARYKYLVLAKDPVAYQKIRTLLKDKSHPQAAEFYEQIDTALSLPDERGRQSNALMHVWGYFKEQASTKEKSSFQKKMTQYQKEEISLDALKKMLLKLSLKYGEDYLLDGYFFG